MLKELQLFATALWLWLERRSKERKLTERVESGGASRGHEQRQLEDCIESATAYIMRMS